MQLEGPARAKALKWECVWHAKRAARSDQEGGRHGVRDQNVGTDHAGPQRPW